MVSPIRRVRILPCMTSERAPLRVSHTRRSTRLPGFDYTRPGTYFVTICTAAGACVFGDVVAGRLELSHAGQITSECWHEIPMHFRNVTLDAFIVMPNHFHGILVVHAVHEPDNVGAHEPDNVGAHEPHNVGAQHAAPLHLPAPASSHKPAGRVIPGSLGAIVRSFKSATTRRINLVNRTVGKVLWQRNYYDRILRNDRELYLARRYVRSNPIRWTGASAS
jgi:putative transposase